MSTSTSKHPRSLIALALALSLAAAACGDSSDPAGPGPVVTAGSYSLTQVRTKGKLQGGGSGLPVTFTDGGGTRLTFLSGGLFLDEDGSYTLSVQATFKGNSLEMTDEGVYVRNGDSVSFSATSGNPRLFTAVMSGSKMTAQSQFGGIPFEIDLQRS